MVFSVRSLSTVTLRNRWSTHGSVERRERDEASRLLRYSVFRSHETCGIGIGVDVPEAEAGKEVEVKILGAADGSSSKN